MSTILKYVDLYLRSMHVFISLLFAALLAVVWIAADAVVKAFETIETVASVVCPVVGYNASKTEQLLVRCGTTERPARVDEKALLAVTMDRTKTLVVTCSQYRRMPSGHEVHSCVTEAK
jgi:hypothetical protein